MSPVHPQKIEDREQDTGRRRLHRRHWEGRHGLGEVLAQRHRRQDMAQEPGRHRFGRRLGEGREEAGGESRIRREEGQCVQWWHA